jgi:NAD(P)-dependent dehydrogenase (short-subunit alcohol dehydrogenase family)
MELEGTVAAVTGAGTGIGRGIALALAGAGAKVVVSDIDPDRSSAVAAELRRIGGEAIAATVDVRSQASVEALAEATVGEFGAVHLVCNNAGVSTMGRQWELSLDDWDWVIDVCLKGVIHGVRSFVPRILEAGGGYVVNVASMGGLMTMAYGGPYAAAKHGVVGLSKGLRAELAGKGVGVSVVCPGQVRTGIVEAMRSYMAGTGTATDEALAVLEVIAAGNDEGISPEAVGDMVRDAIRDERFWVLPNATELLPLVRQDMDEVFATASE